MPPGKSVRKILLTATAREDLAHWIQTNPKIIKRINIILESILVDPTREIGKPEKLKYEPAGAWSRRINHIHRIVYEIHGETVVVLQLRDHY